MPIDDTRPSKAQRQADARARATEMRRRQEQAARRSRSLAITGVIVGVLAIAGAVGYVLAQNHQTAMQYGSVAFGGPNADDGQPGQRAFPLVVPPALSGAQKPSTADDGGGIPVSDQGVGVAGSGDTVLTVYFDLQCPICAQFDAVNASDLQALSAEPGITVVYQPLSFLDYSSQGTRYSNRAANALMAVADAAPDEFQAFLTALFEHQPGELTKGLSDEQIASIASGVGVPGAVVDTFTDTVTGTCQLKDAGGRVTESTGTWRTFAPFVAAATGHAATQPVFQPKGIVTPTLLLNGAPIGAGGSDGVNRSVPGSLRRAVEAAAGRG